MRMDEHNKPNKPKKKRSFFQKKRGGVVLTPEQVKEIKAERKKLRAELRKNGEKSRKEFELTASSLGLYFDGNKMGAMLKWFLVNNGLKVLALLMALLLLIMWGFSAIADLKGHFTINLSDKLFEEGFSLSEDISFKIPTSRLFGTPAINVPCISIVDIPKNINEFTGTHNASHFGYTFYLRNEGKTEADYQWELSFTSKSELSKAVWVMLFVDGDMTIYAQADKDGKPATLPERGNDTVGYLEPPLRELAADKTQYEIIKQHNTMTYWRVVSKPFISDTVVAGGEFRDVQPKTVHKYTVVLWIEGDDPDCTDELIGTSLGLELSIAMIDEKGEGE